MKRYLVISTLFVCMAIVCYSQHSRIQQLKTLSQTLNKKVEQYQHIQDDLLMQYELVNEALNHVVRQKTDAERRSTALQGHLKQAQSGSVCDTVPVPDDVIRMQRDAISNTNNVFTAATDTVSTLPDAGI